MHTEWSRAGEPLDKGSTINGINHLAKATNILWKNTHRGLHCVPKRRRGIWEEKLASRSGGGWETHTTRRNFFFFSFGQRKKKITYLCLISGPRSLFYSISDQFVWIWENLVYSFGTYVKVCKGLGVHCITEKWALNLAVTWPQITFREQIAILSLACSKCKFFSISFSFWQCSYKRLCWFF